LNQRDYRLADVVAATDVPSATLLSWADRGFIPGAKVGRGNRRAFTLKDIDRAAIIAELTRVGLPIAEAAHAVRVFSDQPSVDRSRGSLFLEDGAKTLLVIDGEGTSVVKAHDRAAFEDAMSKLFSKSHGTIVLNVSEVLRRVDAALAGKATPKPPAAMLYRHGRSMAIS
jgi:DNA-binding transcriptional MerR regulator